jgi:hypothetical protein
VIRFRPSLFIGQDGIWWLKTLSQRVPFPLGMMVKE